LGARIAPARLGVVACPRDAALAICVTAAFVALLSSVASLQGAAAAQQAAGQELTVANMAQGDVLAMDTALRGFALTRERRFIVSYDAAKQRFAHDAAALAAAERRGGGSEDPATRVVTREMLTYERSYAHPLIQLTNKRLLSSRELKNRTDAASTRLGAIRNQLTDQTTTSSGDARRRQSRAQAAAVATKRYAISGLSSAVEI
jgi:CHASE3 domain sensor protein